MLDKEKLVAVVSSPPIRSSRWHPHWRELACELGVDVCAEKRLTLTVAEGETLIKAVRKYDWVCQVGPHP